MRDIFISYVEEDGHLTAQLAAGLEAAGYSTWYYERDGVPGESYLLQTRAAIDGCQAVVLIISPSCVKSEQVTKEVVRAHECNKTFLPLRANISHAEFVERRPEWAQALGAATSTTITPETAPAVVPRLLTGLRKMNLMPRPDLVTNEMSVITPEMIREATGGAFAPQPKPAPPRPTPIPQPPPVEEVVDVVDSGPDNESKKKKKLYLIAGAIAAIVIVAVVAFFLTRSKEQEEAEPIQMTTAPVREEFLTLQAWQHPPNWAVGNNALELEEAPEVGWLTDKQFRDFTMSFQLQATNGEGAAWALRVNQDGHYLFHLSGPKGAQPNRFLTYQVNEGNDKMTQVGTPFNVVRPLVEGGVYTISIRVEKNVFNHKIRIDSVPGGEFEGEEHNLGTYQDDQDVFQSGSIGFRTFATEKFSVMDLFVYPPGTRPLQ